MAIKIYYFWQFPWKLVNIFWYLHHVRPIFLTICSVFFTVFSLKNPSIYCIFTLKCLITFSVFTVFPWQFLIFTGFFAQYCWQLSQYILILRVILWQNVQLLVSSFCLKIANYPTFQIFFTRFYQYATNILSVFDQFSTRIWSIFGQHLINILVNPHLPPNF